MPQRTIAVLPALRRELPWLACMAAALIASFHLAHFVVRRGVILPAIAESGAAPPWAYAALYTPELVAAIVIGWRLRAWTLVLLYAGAASILREAFQLAVRWTAGAPEGAPSVLAEIAVALPASIVAYVVVFSLAASSAREGSALLAADRGGDQGPPRRSGILQR